MEPAQDTESQEATDSLNMFASVWVKVELNDEEGSTAKQQCVVTDQNPIEDAKPPKKKRKYNKILNCTQCSYTTPYKNCLDLHLLGHCNIKPYICEYCQYQTKYPSSLYRHISIKHQDQLEVTSDNQRSRHVNTYSCDVCEYTTNYKWNLLAHKRKHKMEKQFKCEHCPYESAYRHNFIKHSKVHKDNQVYRCDKCPFITKFEGHIHRHLSKIHNEVTERAHICELCNFSTIEKWRLNTHIHRSKQEKPLKCSYCDFETYFKCESKKHKRSHVSEIYKDGRVNDDQVEETDIPILDEEYPPSQSHYNRYKIDPDCVDWNTIQVLETANKAKPFQCHMCDYTSKFKASVQRHFQRHHTGIKNRPFKCCNCDFSTKTKDQIALHNKRSQTDVKVTCKLCEYSTNYKCALVLHQKSHNMHKCHMCEYSCRHKHELNKHYTIMHLGDGIKCRYCDFRAARKDSILCHETIHTGDKPFKCDHCDYKSVRKSLLYNHVRRHHSDLANNMTIVSESKIQSLRVSLPDLGVEFENFTTNSNVENDSSTSNVRTQDVNVEGSD